VLIRKLYRNHRFQASHLPAAYPAISYASGIRIFFPNWLLYITVICCDVECMRINVCDMVVVISNEPCSSFSHSTGLIFAEIFFSTIHPSFYVACKLVKIFFCKILHGLAGIELPTNKNSTMAIIFLNSTCCLLNICEQWWARQLQIQQMEDLLHVWITTESDRYILQHNPSVTWVLCLRLLPINFLFRTQRGRPPKDGHIVRKIREEPEWQCAKRQQSFVLFLLYLSHETKNK